MAELIQSLLIILFESICCMFFLDTFLQRKDYLNKWFRKMMLPVMVIFFTIVASLIHAFILKSALVILIIMAIVQIYYFARALENIVLSAIYYGILIGIDYLSIVLIKFLLPERYGDILYSNSASATILILICKIILFIAALIIRKLWKPNDSLDMISNTEWLCLSFFPFFTIVSLSVMFLRLNFDNEVFSILLVIAFGLVIMNFVIFYLISGIVNREKTIRNNRLIQERTKNQMNIYRNMDDIYNRQRKRTHDYKNQFGCIQGMLVNGKIEETIEYIGNITGSLMKDLDTIHTNNAVVDAVINQKYRYAKGRGITIILFVNDLSNLLINEEDLVTLLSNMLDNSIEACEKIQNNKVIKFKMTNEKNQLFISIQNPVKESLKIINNRIITTKENKKEHGIGLLNIYSVVEKYDGTYAIKSKDEWFYLSVLIPYRKS